MREGHRELWSFFLCPIRIIPESDQSDLSDKSDWSDPFTKDK